MNLSDLATIASIVSSAAVALSLVYVALQVRQAEKNQRGLMQQGRADRVSDLRLRIAEGADMAALWTKSARDPENMTADELERYLLLCSAVFISAEDSLLQHRAGLLDEQAFRSWSASAKAQLGASRGMRAAWALLAPQYGREFADYFDALIAKGPPGPAPDRLQAWRDALGRDDGRSA
jgi:hypothetical protein